jgi:two-component system cell cycle response regulator
MGRIKGDPEIFGTAVIMLLDTSLTVAEAVADARQGLHDVIVAPFGEGEVVLRVEAAGRTKQLQEELVSQSRRREALIFEDPLTGLFNRRYLTTLATGLVSASRRHDRPLSAAVIDVDHFKSFNDRHGHKAGDRALVAVGDALRGRLRTEDVLARLGGEEFVALLPDTGAPEAALVAEGLRSSVEGVRVPVGGAEEGVSVSVGWATWAGESAEDLIGRADHAMYAAKAAGRNRVSGRDEGSATVRRRT